MTDNLYQAIFDVAKVLEVPVIIVALLALAVVVVEVGRLGAELNARRHRRSGVRGVALLHESAVAAQRAIANGSVPSAERALRAIAVSSPMADTCAALIAHTGAANADNRLAKDLAEFDFGCQRRLGRTRLLVRVGPALGLMGTLIPLSPALDGLAKGDIATLTQNLRVAFSVTVLGILVGAVAFALSLVRDRLYGQDYSDLEYVASVLSEPVLSEPVPSDDVPADVASDGGSHANASEPA